MKKQGVFCLEGEWEKDLKDRSSIQSLMEFLANGDDLLPSIYRRAATVDAFKTYLKRWKNYPAHSVGYLSFHGEPGQICLSQGQKIRLDELIEILRGTCKGKHLVLSSCQTLKLTENLHEFRKSIGARSVSGYKKSPDWIESSAFDVMVISNLLYHDRPSQTDAFLKKMCAGLIERYGFVMSYQTRS